MNCYIKYLFLAVVAAQLVISNLIQAHEAVKISPLTIGQTLQFKSSILNEDRVLNIYLPASYQKNVQQKYPIILLLDGSLDEDFIHISGLLQFGAFSWIKMVPESIVVGVANVDRKRDFTSPTKNEIDKKELPTSGGSEKFIRMLQKEALPLVKKQYRTNDIETLIGQSLGGLLATEILFKHPTLFDNYIIVSPSLWWNDELLLHSEQLISEQPTSIFIGVGKEGKIMETLAKQLFDKVYPTANEKRKVFFEYFPELDHGDTLHLATYKALKLIFSDRQQK